MSSQPHSKSLWRSRESWFLIALCLFWKSYSLVNPGNIQLDLVFPQDNAVYQPFKAFPIVLILHNINIAWPYRPRMTWQLFSRDTGLKEVEEEIKILDEGEFPNDYHRPTWLNRGFWDETPNNFLFINTTSAIFDNSKDKSNTATALLSYLTRKETNKSFGLSINFSLDDKLSDGRSCRVPNSMQNPSQMILSSDNTNSDIFAISHEVNFNISNSKRQDKIVDVDKLLEMTECPSPVGTIGIIGNQGHDDHIVEHHCPILRSPPPPAKKCVVKIDNYIRKEVSKSIMKASKPRQKQTTIEQEGDKHVFASGAAVMAAITGSVCGVLGLLLSLWTIWAGDVILLEIA